MKTAILACLVAACVDPVGPDLDCSDGKCDQPTGLATANPNLTLYSGYQPLFDRAASQCVTVDQDEELPKGAQAVAGSVSETFDLIFVSSRAELARVMGLDLGVEVKYPLVSVDIGLDLVNRYRSTATTTTVLLKLTEQYEVINRHPLKLTQAAAGKLAAGIDGFVRTCGSRYINGVRFGGHMFVLITYEASDEQTALDLRASLGVQAGVITKVDAQVEARLSNVATTANVTATVSVASQGFMTKGQAASSSLIANLIGSGVSEQTFMRIKDVRTAMQTSLAMDACRDAGASCPDGTTGPGFFDNTQRNARPIGVDTGFYDSLPNADVGTPSPFKRIDERGRVIENFVRDWGALEDRLLAVYRDELEPFQQASDKAAFQIALPGNRVRTPSELVPIAAKWADRFSPPSGSRIGSVVQQVHDAIETCWSAASLDLATSCAPNDALAKTTAAWQAVDAMLGAYADERILPLHVREATLASRDTAGVACQALSTPRLGYRVPNFGEVGLMSPLIGFGTIDWTGARPNSTWFAHSAPGALCSSGVPAWHNSAFDPTDTVECVPASQPLRVLCVPNHGPLPLVARP